MVLDQLLTREDTAQGALQPRYRQIYERLRERIGNGDFPVGSNLPTEVELCEEFGVSRYTVREALRRLVEQGIIARRQGSGSAIIAKEPQHSFVHEVRSLADLFQYALDTHLEIGTVATVAIPAAIAPAVGGEPGAEWLEIKSVRHTRVGGKPICVTHSYIPGRLAWIEPEIRTCVGPLYALLEQRSGEAIINAAQEIRAESMTRPIARALDEEAGAVSLRLLRRYSSCNGTLIASFNWHPGESFTYKLDVQRNSARSPGPTGEV